MSAQLDHLVVVARTLGEGVAWCEATLGITPGPGGEHALFGTHNRLFGIATAQYPQAYFEIIAINSIATQSIKSPAKRWFDLDAPTLTTATAQQPRLVHFVARTPNAAAACTALRAQGIERGPLLQASRPTPKGLLLWQISVREDGQRLFSGALPTLIQWGSVHPTDNMPPSGVTLQSLRVQHPQADALRSAYQSLGLQGVQLGSAEPNLMATLQTPKGVVTLESKGI